MIYLPPGPHTTPRLTGEALIDFIVNCGELFLKFLCCSYHFWQKKGWQQQKKEKKTFVWYSHKSSAWPTSRVTDVCLCNISYSPCELLFICFIYFLLVSLFSAECIKTSARHSTRHLTVAKVNRTRRADSRHITHTLLPDMKNGSNRSTWIYFLLLIFFFSFILMFQF